MRIRDFRADDEPEINLVPLIDVVLVLIIFFVVTTSFDARSVLKLELPRADGVAPDSMAAPLVLLINADGRYFVHDREVLRTDVDALKAGLQDVAGDDRERTVLIRADARTPWQAVITAYEALGQLGFRRIANATAPPVAGGTQAPPDGNAQGVDAQRRPAQPAPAAGTPPQ